MSVRNGAGSGYKLNRKPEPEISEVEMAWLAGLWEGEGSFHLHRLCGRSKSPLVVAKIAMSDKDVIERAAKLMGGRAVNHLADKRKETYKQMYVTAVTGLPAFEWMLRMFPYLGERRRAKVSELLEKWEHY